jgi:hypothetical protein
VTVFAAACVICCSFHHIVPIEYSTSFYCSHSATVDRNANFSKVNDACHWVCKLKQRFETKTENDKNRTEKNRKKETRKTEKYKDSQQKEQ